MSKFLRNEPVIDSDGDIVLPHTVNLKYPVTLGSDDPRIIESLTFKRRCVAADYKGIPAGKIMFEDMYKIVARLVNEPTPIIEKLDSVDMFACIDVVNHFLPSGLTNGDNR